ncbi:synapse-associated protein 1 [Trichonephila clavipes]|nr:synapse-associated protein 1 [Trichonephila clavipes]
MCGERLTTDLFVSTADVLDMLCATAERERLSLTSLETADGTSTTLAMKKKYADQTLLAILRQVPREADPQYVVTDPRRHIADPVSRQAIGARKTKESDLPRRNFLRNPPTGVMFDFNFDTMYPVAKTMLKEDPALENMRFEIVPKLINEENFWRNYFYRVQLVKNSSRLSKMAQQKNSSGDSSASSEKSSSNDSVKGLDKTTAEGGPESDATDSPNHEFVSDSFQLNQVSEEDIKQGMKMLGVTDKNSREDDWEKEMQQELQEYEVVVEGNDEDQDWENEINEMLEDKVKDAV